MPKASVYYEKRTTHRTLGGPREAALGRDLRRWARVRSNNRRDLGTVEEKPTSEWKLLIMPQASNATDARKEKRDGNVFIGSNIWKIIDYLNGLFL